MCSAMPRAIAANPIDLVTIIIAVDDTHTKQKHADSSRAGKTG
jgi:flagellar basal body L-ring protein FlgH